VAEIILTYTLINGGVYALLAIGFSLIFGVARVINMAHTAFFMLSAYLMWFLSRELGWGILQTIVVAVAGVTLLGLLIYRFILDRVREHHAAVLLITIALAMIFEQVVAWHMMGTSVHTIQKQYLFKLIPGHTTILGVDVYYQHLLVLGVAVVIIIVLQLLLTKTRLGIAVRATSQDAEIAGLMGISVSRILMLSMAGATFLAAVGGILLAPIQGVWPAMWNEPLVIIMVIVVLGGLGSIKGSIIGAFIVALVQQLAAFLLPEGGYLVTTFVLLAMVIVLVVRPGGLFGILLEEERL